MTNTIEQEFMKVFGIELKYIDGCRLEDKEPTEKLYHFLITILKSKRIYQEFKNYNYFS